MLRNATLWVRVEHSADASRAPLRGQVHGAVCEHDGSKLFTDVTLRGLWTGWSGFRETWDEHHMHQARFCTKSCANHLPDNS